MQGQPSLRPAIAAAGLLVLTALPPIVAAPELNSYVQHNLVSDIRGRADHLDPKLVNPWGISFNPTGPFWISDNGTGVTTVYDGQGRPAPMRNPLTVTIPPPLGVTPPSAPTGQVFNGTGGFPLTPGLPALFIFATEDGTISGWNPGANSTQAIRKVDRASFGAVYKGLAIAPSPAGVHIYAANFRAGTIDVFDTNFNPVTLAGIFFDPTIPAGFAPFNIQNIDGQLFVTYAKQDGARKDDVAGPGNGYVNVFDTNGVFVRRFASAGTLNSPWGVVRARAGFGAFSNHLLIGNFGDGKINAFEPASGVFRGQLQDGKRKAIQIDGLWALVFGNGGMGGDTDKLYFTAGIEDEKHGLFGQIRARHPDDDDNDDNDDNEGEDRRHDDRN
jgi:uncharacterized protein (TIGR03118 family)